MNKTQLVQKSYEIAKERYSAVGVNVDQALEQLQKLSISIHCWQADDVTGFGTLIPAVLKGDNLLEGDGLILLIGVSIAIAGIAIIGYAGS